VKYYIPALLINIFLLPFFLSGQSFVKVPGEQVPFVKDNINDKSLVRSLNNSLKYLNKLDSARFMKCKMGSRNVTVYDLQSSLQTFIDIYTKSKSQSEFRHSILKNFEFYRFENSDLKPDIWITSYYSPTIRASRVRTGVYQYPLYYPPKDLVVFNSKEFIGKMNDDTVECMLQDNKLVPWKEGEKIILNLKESKWIWTGGKIVGRIKNGLLVPYYNRKEIDVDKVLDKNSLAEPIAWLSSPVEAMNVHIQGSATLQFSDTDKAEVFAMYTNALPFKDYVKAICLVKNLPINKNTVHKYLLDNPDEALLLLSENPRYVFFYFRDHKMTEENGEKLTPFRSVAVDSRYIPLGSLAFMEGRLTTKDKNQKSVVKETGIFVLAQDIGGAVKGLHVDYFVGPNLLKTINDRNGRYYILLKK
jgi:membrane-bound lytic murein transglycosylase A